VSFKKTILILLIIIIGLTLFFEYVNIDGPPNNERYEDELGDPEEEEKDDDEIDLSPDEDPFRAPTHDPGGEF